MQNDAGRAQHNQVDYDEDHHYICNHRLLSLAPAKPSRRKEAAARALRRPRAPFVVRRRRLEFALAIVLRPASQPVGLRRKLGASPISMHRKGSSRSPCSHCRTAFSWYNIKEAATFSAAPPPPWSRTLELDARFARQLLVNAHRETCGFWPARSGEVKPEGN